MFGYVTIHKDELKVKEYNLYKAYYCGLCQALKKEYGFPARLFLSNDASFLAILLSAAGQEEPAFKSIHCLVNPAVKRSACCGDACLSYAAAVNVLLVWFKLLDDWRDNRSLRALLLLPWMAGKQHKAKAKYPVLYAALKKDLDALGALEQAHSAEPDAAAAAFGKVMADIFDPPFPFSLNKRRVLMHSGYLVGRLIYLLDAWEDREADRKHKSYNPFLYAEPPDLETFRLSLEYSLGELGESLKLLDLKRNQSIIENIVYLGLKNTVDRVLNGQKPIEERHNERPL